MEYAVSYKMAFKAITGIQSDMTAQSGGSGCKKKKLLYANGNLTYKIVTMDYDRLV